LVLIGVNPTHNLPKFKNFQLSSFDDIDNPSRQRQRQGNDRRLQPFMMRSAKTFLDGFRKKARSDRQEAYVYTQNFEFRFWPTHEEDMSWMQADEMLYRQKCVPKTSE
jgi:hypothetical protein